MLISYAWLQDFIKEPLPEPAELADKLVMHSLEVEGCSKIGLRYPGVKVGYVEKVEAHPKADRLTLCTVDIGESRPAQIVCGGENVASGQWVPVATVGTTLPTGLKIESAVIREVASEGMICSSEELGEPATGRKDIKVLTGPRVAGELYDEYQQTGTDHVFDIDVLANRAPDCLSHRGIAREVAAIFGLTFLDYSGEEKETEGERLKIDIQDPERCRRYIGALMTGLSVQDSPVWLRDRLVAVGLRPINNIVDATNYIMYGLGQPLHAFDADKLRTDKNGCYQVGVRKAHGGEKITTLDEGEYELPESATVITDENQVGQPIALAGVMGGLASAVESSTVNVILEAAVFDPVLTRQTSRGLKLLSDASKRFENGISPALTAMAMPALLKLLREIAGGPDTRVTEVIDQYPGESTLTVNKISLSIEEINKYLGSEIQAQEAEQILDRLQFIVTRREQELIVQPPADRLDVAIKEEVIEEVGRIYGYNRIEEAGLPEFTHKPAVNHRFYWTHRIRDLLASWGWGEVMTYTLRARGELEISNPLASDKAYFRDTLTDGVTDALKKNSKFLDLLGQDKVRIYEIGAVYQNQEEKLSLALGAGDKKGPAAGEIETALERLEGELGVKIAKNRTINKGVLEIYLEPVLEQLPAVADYSDLQDLGQTINYRSISVYPFCLRDVAVWVPNSVSTEQVRKIIVSEAGKLLVNLYLFDTYQKDGRFSYAFRLVFQASDRTLSDGEVNEIMDQVYAKLNRQKGWATR